MSTCKPLLRRSCCLLLCMLLCLPLFPFGSGIVAQAADAEEICGHLADGSNVEAQNYSTWAYPIRSYLTPTPDGLMRMQANAVAGHYFIEYYDAAYQIQDTVLVEAELPIFGGFYATDSNYYILSGQMNREESPAVECFRITKYDLNWNRITSAGLYDCNTTVPFDAGSARMTHSGKYLLIRTSHEMYTYTDGLNHQANVTIQLDMESMEITDSYTTVMNVSAGYVSHSFNQFIRVEDNHIVAVDHGDAHPRSIVLMKYPTDISTGTFHTYSCKYTDLFTFKGSSGYNYTGASVGGFEISNSSYLVTFNSVVQDETFSSHKTRNIFVSAMDKETSEVTIHQITDIAEGEGTASTPQLVKLSDSEFLLLWSLDGEVYYTKLDSEGNTASPVYQFTGALSDCVPVLSGDKVIWYTWKNSVITFYDVDVNDLSSNVTEIDRLKVISYPTEAAGDCTIGCTACDYTESFQTLTSLRMSWNAKSYGAYTSTLADSYPTGTQLRYWLTPNPSNLARSETVYTLSKLIDGEEAPITEDEAYRVVTSTYMGYFMFLQPGTYIITVSALYNPLVTNSYTITVVCDHDFVEQPDPQYLKEEATCVSPALYYMSCSVCGEAGEETFIYGEVNTDNHVNVRNKGTDATCTEEGYSEEICDDCGKTLSREDLPATGHTFGEWKQTKAPTCTEKGTEERVCDVCSEKETRDIEATGHDWEDDFTVDKQPSCTEAGSKSIHCKNCDETTDVTSIPATGHTFGEWKQVKAPACTEKGTEERVCEVCNEKESRDIVATGHNWEDDFTVDKQPSCTEAGSKSIHCKNCDETTDVTPIPATGHQHIKTVRTEPTCTVDGSVDEICEDCGETLSHEDIPATGHTFGEWEQTKAPTCTEKGAEERVCDACDEKETREIPVTDHDWEDTPTVKLPTCTKDGSIATHCKNCDETKGVTTLPAPGHTFGEWTRIEDPTCTEKGVEEHVCEVCGEKETNEIPANGHAFGEWKETKAPTCTEEGAEERACDVCGEKETRAKAATGHLHTATVRTEPTCTEEGSVDEFCTDCWERLTHTAIPALGHDYEDDVCTRCGQKKPAVLLGDVNGDGVIDATDYMLLKRAVLGTYGLDELGELAGDIDQDGEITATDYMLLKRHVLGTYTIKQPE